jgi:hypothetical protein
VHVVRALVAVGADVNMPARDGTTPVSNASEKGNLEVVKALAAIGADVGLPANRGSIPLHAGAGHPSAVVCEFLLSMGADPLARDEIGRTAADWAVAVHDQCVFSLFDRTATVAGATGRACPKCGTQNRLRLSCRGTCTVRVARTCTSGAGNVTSPSAQNTHRRLREGEVWGPQLVL